MIWMRIAISVSDALARVGAVPPAAALDDKQYQNRGCDHGEGVRPPEGDRMPPTSRRSSRVRLELTGHWPYFRGKEQRSWRMRHPDP
jgi:hypothetical protein